MVQSLFEFVFGRIRETQTWPRASPLLMFTGCVHVRFCGRLAHWPVGPLVRWPAGPWPWAHLLAMLAC